MIILELGRLGVKIFEILHSTDTRLGLLRHDWHKCLNRSAFSISFLNWEFAGEGDVSQITEFRLF